MRHRPQLPQLAVVVASLFMVAVLSARQDVKVELKTPYSPAGYQTLSGTITFNGKRPQARRIDTSTDPVCLEVNPQLTTDYFVGDEGRLANALIYVESETMQTYSFKTPTEPVLLEHKGCSFVPRVLGMRAGQPLGMANKDATYHNNQPRTQKNPEWKTNLTQPPGAPPLVKTFTLPEKPIVFRCNRHPWEKGIVAVFDHPFFAVSDGQGRFKIEGLPPGQYKVSAWHEFYGEKSVDITFLPDEPRELTFEFMAAEP